jgi:hypothetical protein
MKRLSARVLICWIALALFSLASCAGGAGSRPDSVLGPVSSDTVRIARLETKQLEAYGSKGTNPYVVRSSLLFKNDQPVFYVYELALPPSSRTRVSLVSGMLTDGSGAEIGMLMAVEDLRGYWNKYLMPETDKQEIHTIIDRTYMGTFDFDYSSSKSRSYILVFKGDAPARVDASATFDLKIGGQVGTITIE